jgi:hypothetical protein
MTQQSTIKHTYLLSSLAIAALLVLPMAQAAGISKADYKAGKDQISASYKSDKAGCDSQSGNAKDICVQQAKGKEKVALAELDYKLSTKPADMTKVSMAKADATYAVAKETCDDLSGNPKDVCVKEAKAVHVKAQADAKLTTAVGEAKHDASQDKRDADYKVAAEKCESMAGDAKTACMADAKSRFGKT